MTEAKRDPWWLARWARDTAGERDLSALAAHVLLVLASYADIDTGKCRPGRGAIARAVRRDPKTVDKGLKELREKGLIERRGGGPGRTSWTTLLPGADYALASSQDSESAVLTTQERGVKTTQGRGSRPRTSASSRPRTSASLTTRENSQENGEVPGVPTSRPEEDPDADEGDPLAREIRGTLSRAVAGVQSETTEGHTWPDPRLDEIASIHREQQPGAERARRAAAQTRLCIQRDDRAPHVAGLYAKVLAETGERPDPEPDPTPAIAGFVEATRMGRRPSGETRPSGVENPAREVGADA